MRRSFTRTIMLLCFTVTATASFSQILQTAAPASVQFSEEKLKRIDGLVQQYIDSGWINGATAIIARNGKIVYYKGLGYDDAATKKPLPKDAIMRIASQTKAITSVAVMMLYEEGKFLLDDAVSKYIPEFKNPVVLDSFNEADTTYTTVPAKSEITIRQLLTHTSGIHYAQIGNKTFNAIYAKAGIIAGIGVNRIKLADIMKKLGSLPLAHQPGEKFTYGLNTDLLGYLVEVVSGMSFNVFLKTRIFEPLGMKDTYFYLPAEKQNRLATLYTEDDTRHIKKAAATMDINGTFYTNYPNMNGTYFSGGGGLASTAYDYAVFMQMLLNNGVYNGKRILSRNTIRMMTTNQIGDLRLGQGNTFGLGFELVTEKGSAFSPRSEGSYSWGGMFSSSYWIDPKEKIVAQLFLQLYPNSHGDIHEKFKVLTYQALTD
ncbi:serine hydrolase domain-containing protein [Agriterribacter sp.]|uniref:serine hydrolase domain-containing protein n=1 Tax=Agriterribacter sp. TaxID=2821509 RepID=UPI002C77D4FE|nr:serine hydrolase domain-containing protein [Agriterribacter sp.]HRO45419.1 serine hydrolase domain-containing protein [Agriterribacter sp.]HRQ16890.1 serine hydrolase domain-containing protein [Agriterribacter sp.]